VAFSLEQLRRAISKAGFLAAAAMPAVEFSDWRQVVLSRPGYEDFPSLPSRADPRASLAGARSVIVAVWDYSTIPTPRSGRGKVARLYLSRSDPPEQGDHPAGRLMEQFFKSRGWKFTAALPRREAAVAAGLVQQRRNCLGYLPAGHSFVSLFAWAVDAEIEPGRLLRQDTGAVRATPLTGFVYPGARHDPCGGCRLCIDRCPTGALASPYVLDPCRCIDRNTWRAGESLPRSLRSDLGTRIYGCDVCQEVCPFNRRVLSAAPASAPPGEPDFDLARLATVGDEEYHAVWAKYFVYNPDRNDIRRNAVVAIGNAADPTSLPLLGNLLSDEVPVVRGHAAWALGRFATPAAKQALEAALARESEPAVREEIAAALDDCAERA